MPGLPDVSVVVIAFNEQATIEDCLAALLAQATALRLEVTVVDDGSTDRTPDIVRRISGADERLSLISHETNRGRGAARRTGQDAATAQRIGFVDADVVVPPTWVARCVAALATKSAVSGIATPDGDCVVLARLFHPTVRVRRHTMAISGGNVMFDAAALRSVGFDADARLGEDFRVARRMSMLGMEVATIPDLVSEHRESKSYPTTVRWMWQNGIDAARLPFELRTVRVPDVTWLAWLATLVVLAVAAGLGGVRWELAVGGAVVATVVVAVGHMASRFAIVPRALRWVAALALDVPLVSAYLAGRTVGLPAAIAGALRRAS